MPDNHGEEHNGLSKLWTH